MAGTVDSIYTSGPKGPLLPLEVVVGRLCWSYRRYGVFRLCFFAHGRVGLGVAFKSIANTVVWSTALTFLEHSPATSKGQVGLSSSSSSSASSSSSSKQAVMGRLHSRCGSRMCLMSVEDSSHKAWAYWAPFPLTPPAPPPPPRPKKHKTA